jgi:type I restriction enzyme S subunit
LGKVPEHWDVRRLKEVCRKSALYGANVPASSYSSTGIRFLRITDIREDGSLKLGGVYVSSEIAIDYVLNDGDLLISRSGTVGRSFLYDSATHGPCAYAGYLVRFVLGNMVMPKFLLYFTKTPSFNDFLKIVSIQSTIENVNGEKYANFILPLPSFTEQSAIVHYLNYFDRRIRLYILANQKLIKLLEEQKQAIIHKAVTRGLDPHIQLKPSGMEWLGDIPEHWTLRRFKFITRITRGQIDPRTETYRDWILIAPNHIESATGKILSMETAAHQGADSGKYLAKMGQIIYSKIRPNLRKAVIAPIDCLCSADMYAISVRQEELRIKYLLLLMLSTPFTKYAVDSSMRVAMPKVNRDALNECWLWYPSLREQDEILSYLTVEIRPSGAAIERTRQEIALIREYRTRLISDVVTGKVDVREPARSLPMGAGIEEPEELENETFTNGDDSLDDGNEDTKGIKGDQDAD